MTLSWAVALLVNRLHTSMVNRFGISFDTFSLKQANPSCLFANDTISTMQRHHGPSRPVRLRHVSNFKSTMVQPRVAECISLRNIRKRRTTRRIGRRCVSVRTVSTRLSTGIDRLTIDVAINHVSRIISARSVRYKRGSVHERLRGIEIWPYCVARAPRSNRKALRIQLRISVVGLRVVGRCGVGRCGVGRCGVGRLRNGKAPRIASHGLRIRNWRRKSWGTRLRICAERRIAKARWRQTSNGIVPAAGDLWSALVVCNNFSQLANNR